MLSRHDDFPIHQTPEPVAHPSTSDRNFYDRYWFNGFSTDGELFFAIAMGLYPNRRVMDTSFSVVRNGRQHSLHASRLAPEEREETRVGPMRIEVVEPMRTLRVHIEPNETGIDCDLVFQARSTAIEEPRTTHHDGGRAVMDSTRFTQFGRWQGSIGLEGSRIELPTQEVRGTRDRSWGVRPVGEREAAAPGAAPQFYWIWAPIQFDGFCTHFGVNEDAEGRPWHQNGVVIPVYGSSHEIPDGADPHAERMGRAEHRIHWKPGTRRAESAEIELLPLEGSPRRITLEPFLTFQMLGLGYFHPEWGHGLWKGENVLAAESWTVAELDPIDPRHIHVQQLCRAHMGEHEGIGVLEQLVIGPHRPSGFKSLFDGAA